MSEIKLLTPEWDFCKRTNKGRNCVHRNSNPTNGSIVENVSLNELFLSRRYDGCLLDSFTKELVSNASGEIFTDNTLNSFTNLLPDQVNLEGQWEVAFSEISYPSVYQNITEGKFKFFDKKLSKSTSTYSIEPGLYTSITDIVEAMNTLIQEKQPQRNLHNSQGFWQNTKSCNYACKR